MPYYTSKFKVKNGKSPVRKRSWNSYHNSVAIKKKKKFLNLAKFRKAFVIGCGMFVILLFIGALYGFGYLQQLTEKLPSPDKPFGAQNAASEIYDRNGKLLYRVYGNENRDPVVIADVPPLMKWSILAAEDMDFYNHPGVDLVGIIRCGFKNLAGTSGCGGSTVTQQLIKQTALTNERSWERKIQEVILALQIEKQRKKDEILEMYLNVVPEGSNVYGIRTASKVYFNKDLKDLNLAEMAILASIPQDPNNLSPTHPLNGNTSQSQIKVKERQTYVLDQMEKNLDTINKYIKDQNGIDNALTKQQIDEARAYVMVYTSETKKDQLKAPHFVMFVKQLLQERGYNNGDPFTLDNLETKGYKIYTTLDLDYEEIAEEQVKKGVDIGEHYGGHNAALVSLNPKNGEILAMAGSADYYGTPYPAGCKGSACMFDPQVNIIDTLQSYGSSMKPMVYYTAMEKGLISAGTLIPDIRVKIPGYGANGPKNYGSVFTGIRPARVQLADSQNIPAISLIDQMGADTFVKEMQRWGYSTLTDPRGYGPSIAVGGADIKLIDHAQAYGILANAGKLVRYEAILKIVDRNGNVVFEYQPKEEQIADPRGTFIISDILNANNDGPPLNAHNGGAAYKSMGNRDVAGKTGTSESGTETLFCVYTPEIVVVGWMGNNNNAHMDNSVSGFKTARPWINEFLLRVSPNIPATPFNKPAGVVTKGVCDGDAGACAEVGKLLKMGNGRVYHSLGGDYGIVDINPPASVSIKQYNVCVDQPDHLARQIDKDMGKAMTINVNSFNMVDSKFQSTLDAYVASQPELHGIVPKEYCTINRNPSGDLAPWAVFSSPASGAVVTDTVNLAFTAFTANAGATVTKAEVSIDGGAALTVVTTLPYSGALNISGYGVGNHTVKVKVFDSTGATGTSSIAVEILGSLNITPVGGLNHHTETVTTINYDFSGSNPLETATLYVGGTASGTCTIGNNGTCTFTTPATTGDLSIQVKGTRKGSTISSNTVTIHVI